MKLVSLELTTFENFGKIRNIIMIHLPTGGNGVKLGLKKLLKSMVEKKLGWKKQQQNYLQKHFNRLISNPEGADPDAIIMKIFK